MQVRPMQMTDSPLHGWFVVPGAGSVAPEIRHSNFPDIRILSARTRLRVMIWDRHEKRTIEDDASIALTIGDAFDVAMGMMIAADAREDERVRAALVDAAERATRAP
jgi:hypothetical protein